MQSMRVLVFASQKGGSGKTTLAGHIGVQAELAGAGPVALIDTDPQGSLAKWWNCREATTLAGHIGVQAELAGAGPVALIDTDPQGSLAKWWNCREATTPAFIHSVFTNLVHDLDEARAQGFKLVVIDTPPAVTKAIAEVISFADLVVLPTRPSPHDLRAVGPTIDICEARKKPMLFTLNAATARAKITMEAAVALSQHGTVAPVTIHNRTDFAASMIDGRTVMEIEPDGKSAEEIRELWEYIDSRLARRDAKAAETGDVVALRRGINAAAREVPTFGRRAN